MDIEELSKSQIVLLTLLVSFVTSIATGIVTVSLMDQAPPAVAQTVNRIIERTIQTVAATTTPGSQAAATVVTQEKTVIVNESDLIAKAVAKIEPSVVRLYTSGEEPEFLGMGIVLDDQGYVFTDSSALQNDADATLVLSDGTRVRAFVSKRDEKSGFAFLQATSTANDETPPVWTPATISTANPVLGASVVALSGKTVARIAPGVITSVLPAEEGGAPILDTDIAGSDLLNGSVLMNTDGAIVGVSTGVSRTSSASGFISTSVLLTPPAPEIEQ